MSLFAASDAKEMAVALNCHHTITRALSYCNIQLAPLIWATPIEWNWRLKNSAGRAWPMPHFKIELHPGLRESSKADQIEVFLHELAHIFAFRLYGRAGTGHGLYFIEQASRLGINLALALKGHKIAACKQRAKVTLEGLGL